MYEKIRKECAKLTSIRNSISQVGEGNSQYGTRWICNIQLKRNLKIDKITPIPEGWIGGRNKWNRCKPCPTCSQFFVSRSNSNIYCNEKCRPSKKGCVGHPHTLETKQKIREANLGDKNPKRRYKMGL
jgi:ribosomal protein L37AE/L43A